MNKIKYYLPSLGFLVLAILLVSAAGLSLDLKIPLTLLLPLLLILYLGIGASVLASILNLVRPWEY